MKSKEKRFSVHGTIDNVELTRAGSALKLIVESRGERLGELQIGRGSLFWWGAHRKNRKRVHWSRFADVMNELAYGKE